MTPPRAHAAPQRRCACTALLVHRRRLPAGNDMTYCSAYGKRDSVCAAGGAGAGRSNNFCSQVCVAIYLSLGAVIAVFVAEVVRKLASLSVPSPSCILGGLSTATNAATGSFLGKLYVLTKAASAGLQHPESMIEVVCGSFLLQYVPVISLVQAIHTLLVQ